MKQEKIQREIEKAKEIAKEYKDKGFRVIISPKLNELPSALRNLGFEPDIIAQSKEINLVIEIKSASTMRNSSHLARIANEVNNIDGWEFELVYTNPRISTETFIEQNSINIADAKHSMKRADDFLLNDISHNYNDAALMLIWSALEATLRAVYSTYKSNKSQIPPKSLVRNLVMLGVLSKADQEFVESMMSLRNKFAHGYKYETVSRSDLRKLISLGNKIIRENSELNSA